MKQSVNYNLAQLLTCVLARDLENTDIVAYGLHAELGLGAALLAQMLHAPYLRIRHGLRAGSGLPLSAPAWSERMHQGWKQVDYWEEHPDMLLWGNPASPETFSTVFFIGGMQIDQWGATNLIGIRNRVRSTKQNAAGSPYAVRGPGSVGTPSAAFFCKKYYIFSLMHTPKVFVPEVDYVSVPGTNRLQELGYLDKRPRLCVTPLGVFDWDTRDGRMQIRSLHPGVSLETVVAQTGFNLQIPARIPVTALPTKKEIVQLSRLDQQGAFERLHEKMTHS
ncbi:MAG TPA: hypothetical protein PKL83_01795 [bacterium]|nr:hypothetical protein [bacterium]